jgi:hypothetical protein
MKLFTLSGTSYCMREEQAHAMIISQNGILTLHLTSADIITNIVSVHMSANEARALAARLLVQAEKIDPTSEP